MIIESPRPTLEDGGVIALPDTDVPRPPYFCTIKTFTNPAVPDRMFIRAELVGELKGNIPYRAYTNPIWFKDVRLAGGFRPTGDGPISPTPSKEAPKPVPTNKSCSKSGITLCQRNGASCEVLKDKRGSSKDVCRWKSKRTANECNKTIGLWTTAKSRYARNHPKAVAFGTAGACITEVTNVRNRID